MDLKKIGQFCKKSGCVRIVYHPGSKCLWVGDGKALWLCDEGIDINRQNCGAMLDIDIDGSITVTEGDSDLAMYDGYRMYANVDVCEVLGCGVIHNRAMLALKPQDEDRIGIIPFEYAKMVKDEDERSYLLLPGPGKLERPVCAVLEGMYVRLLVALRDTEETEDFVRMAGRIARMEPYEDGKAEQTRMEDTGE